jgi:TetR/AcrR family transcriptional regulator, regulator of cefoperazone and chloramphenicol sensitivity
MASAKAVAEDGRRRRPAAGGYPRGDETRARIIAAALEVFGRNGFDGSSTRMLAERAGVTLPALHYYFDSKEGVYLACAEHIADRMQAHLGATTARIAQALARQELPSAQVFAMLLELVDEFADLFLGEHELEQWVMFIIREQAQPTKAFDILFDRMMNRVVDTSTALIARLLDRPQNAPEVRIKALALFGRIIFLRTAREAALRVLHWPDFDGKRLALVKEVIHAQAAAEFGVTANGKRRRRS